jgi:hypothetical protein
MSYGEMTEGKIAQWFRRRFGGYGLGMDGSGSEFWDEDILMA